MNASSLLLVTACLGLSACDPVTMGLVTAGGGMAVNHQMSATATRTFSEGAEPVHAAVLNALQRMSIEVTHTDHRGEVLLIDGKAGTRHVAVQVEPVTRTSTLLEVSVRQDLLTLDGATGREIVAQTELALAQSLHAGSAPTTAHAPALAAGSGTASPANAGKTTYYGADHAGATRVAKAARAHSHSAPTPTAVPAAAGASSTPAAGSAGAGSSTANGATANPSASGETGGGRVIAQVRQPDGSRLAAAAGP